MLNKRSLAFAVTNALWLVVLVGLCAAAYYHVKRIEKQHENEVVLAGVSRLNYLLLCHKRRQEEYENRKVIELLAQICSLAKVYHHSQEALRETVLRHGWHTLILLDVVTMKDLTERAYETTLDPTIKAKLVDEENESYTGIVEFIHLCINYGKEAEDKENTVRLPKPAERM